MKTQTKATQELNVYHDEDNGRYLVMRGGVLLADCGKGNFGKTEAERMVTAVNSHDELLEALKLCERALEERDQEQEEYAAKKAREIIQRAERGSK